MNAAIYARFSSSGQREESIEGQLRDCNAYAKRNGLTVVAEYADKAISGRTDKRPDFQRMLKDSEKGAFQLLICWKMDRFARNRYDSAIYKAKLKKAGVRVVYAMESIPEGPEGIILESVMEGYAEYYSENLAQNVRRGYYDSALELKTLGAKPLGLKKGPGDRFVVDPETAPVVKRIFEEYASGRKINDIIEGLNAEGYRTARGLPFTRNSLQTILANEKYIGVYEFKDIRVENAIEPIIDKTTWEAVQKMRKRRVISPAASRDVNFKLTTKLYCGECGCPMTGDSGTSRSGQTYYYYTCSNKKRGRHCKSKSVRKDDIEKLVIDQLLSLICSDQFIEDVADLCMEYQDRERDASLIASLEQKKKEIDKKIGNLTKALEDGRAADIILDRLDQLKAEREDIERGIAVQLIEDPRLDRDQIIFYLQRLRERKEKPEELGEDLIETFLNSAHLYDDGRLVLGLNFTGDRSKLTIEDIGKIKDPSCSNSTGQIGITHRKPNMAIVGMVLMFEMTA